MNPAEREKPKKDFDRMIREIEEDDQTMMIRDIKENDPTKKIHVIEEKDPMMRIHEEMILHQRSTLEKQIIQIVTK